MSRPTYDSPHWQAPDYDDVSDMVDWPTPRRDEDDEDETETA